MTSATKILALLLFALGSCQARRRHHVDETAEEEIELVAQPSRFGSLWPLPQQVQISEVSFKLTGFSFRIVDAKQSSAGPSCAVLQDAYRRCQPRLVFASFVTRHGATLVTDFPLSLSLDIMTTCSATLRGPAETKAGERVPRT